jgi:hypothetical protein
MIVKLVSNALRYPISPHDASNGVNNWGILEFRDLGIRKLISTKISSPPGDYVTIL